jgi:putative endonuclease
MLGTRSGLGCDQGGRKISFQGQLSRHNELMGFLRSIAAKTAPKLNATTKSVGDGAEELALQYLLRQGLMLVARNFKTPGRGGGEIDLILRDSGATLVFVEVRRRKSSSHGGAASSITATKQQRIIYAAQHFLARLPRAPACRFDVVCVEGDGLDVQLTWLKAAFDAS